MATRKWNQRVKPIGEDATLKRLCTGVQFGFQAAWRRLVSGRFDVLPGDGVSLRHLRVGWTGSGFEGEAADVGG